MRRHATGARPHRSGPWWALVGLLACCFALGGSARADVPQLMVLRPIAVLLLGYALIRLRREDVRAHRITLAVAGVIFAVPLLQLVPLPPAIWHLLTDRGLIAEVDQLAGIGPVWRPLSFAPTATGNAVAACTVPLAALLLGLQVPPEERVSLLPAVIVLAGLSGLVGLLQIVSGGDGALYPYPITNLGSAVGLFANRNHQATLLALMIPMLAIAALHAHHALRLAAVAGGLLVLPLILITGSRSGIILAVLALAALPLILRGMVLTEHSEARVKPLMPATGVIIGLLLAGAGLLLVALTAWSGRGEAWSRLVATGGEVDQRLQLLPTLVPLISRYLPFGAGFGTFERVFQLHEPDSLLGPSVTNHAHNDWLEILLEGGLPAALLLLGGIVAFCIWASRAWSGPSMPPRLVACARLGLVAIALEAAASAVDYPLRTPIHAVLFVVAVLWILGWGQVRTKSKLLDRTANSNHRETIGSGVGTA